MENLLAAWDAFKPGKRNKIDVQEFELRLEDNLFQLHRDLVTKKYEHGAYIGFYVRDPKVRRIHKSNVRDRVLHHAMVRALNPIFEPTFIADSYSSRTNKGTHKGVERAELFARKVQQTHGRCFVLKCDIRKFFSTIDHKVLIEIVERRIKDKDAIWLIKKIIDSFTSEFSDTEHIRGTPIGNLTSQLFANIYMNEFDQFVKHQLRIPYYVRYTDDFVIIHHYKSYLESIKNEVAEFLTTKLRLSLHPDKVSIRKFKQGIDFLGYVSLPKARVLRTRVRRRIFRKLKWHAQQFKEGKITEEVLLRSFDSYLGILSHADSYELRNKLHIQFLEWLKEPISDKTKRDSRPAAHID